MNLTLSTIAAMCRQEQKEYTVKQTIPLLLQRQQQDYFHAPSSHHFPAHLTGREVTESTEASAPMMMIDEDSRTKMAVWCYQVVDFCKVQRETVEIAMNFLDRFIATKAGQAAVLDRKVYQLAAMTCLYTAAKIHEQEAMDPTFVSKLSKGTYSARQIEEMEATILMALQWRVNPPTALSFVRQFLQLIPCSVLNETLRHTVYDLSKYQTELAVNESESVTLRACTIAFCALMNSLESVGLHSTLQMKIGNYLSQSIGLFSYFRGTISSNSSCNYNDDMILNIQNWLYEAVQRQPACVSSKLRLSLKRRSAATTTKVAAPRRIQTPPSSFGSAAPSQGNNINNNNKRSNNSGSETSPRSTATFCTDKFN